MIGPRKGLWPCLAVMAAGAGLLVVQVLRPLDAEAPDAGRPAAIADSADGRELAAQLPQPGGDERAPMLLLAATGTVEPAPEAGAGVALHGRAHDPSGAPLAGARVWLLTPPSEEDTLSGLGYLGSRSRRHDDLVLDGSPSTLCDADGAFALLLPAAVAEADVTHLLAVAHPGWATATLAVDDFEDPRDVLSVPELRVAGRAVDEEGHSLAGVAVRVASNFVDRRGLPPDATPWCMSYVPGLMSCRTDEDGRFEIAGLWPGRLSIELRAPGRVRAVAAPDDSAPAGVLDLGDVVVLEGGAIAGRVLDPHGTPVAGAQLAAASWEIRSTGRGCGSSGYDADDDTIHDELRQLRERFDRDPVLTDATGSFRLAALDAATWDVYASAPGFEPVRLRDVSAGARNVVLSLQAEARLIVRIVDPDSGAPCPEATLAAQRLSDIDNEWGEAELAVLTGAEAARVEPGEWPAGTFLVRGAGPRANRLVAQSAGRARTVLDLAGVPVGGRDESELGLPRESILAGRVRDASGAGLAQARILRGEADEAWFEEELAQTDAQGAFRIGNLPAGSYLLFASAEGLPDSARTVIELGAGEAREELELRLAVGASLSGRVLDASGQPLAGHSIGVQGEPFDEWVNTCDATTDEQGQYEIRGLAAGRYLVSVGDIEAPVVQVTLEDGGAGRADFRAAPASRLRGRVLQGGQPVAAIIVAAERLGSPLEESETWIEPTTTDADGLYELELPGAGTYVVAIEGQGVVSTDGPQVTVPVGAVATLDLQLPGGRLAGQIVGEVGGTGLEGAALTLIDGDDEQVGWTKADEQGRFELRGVPAGDFTLRSRSRRSTAGGERGNAFRVAETSVTLADGEERSDILLRACPGSSLSGRVTLPAGALAKQGAVVYLVRVDGGGAVPIETLTCSFATEAGAPVLDSPQREPPSEALRVIAVQDGTFRLDALPAGTYRIVARARWEEMDAQTVLSLGATVVLLEHQAVQVDLVTSP
jgi:Carboxypeptidase regulatory-like domain